MVWLTHAKTGHLAVVRCSTLDPSVDVVNDYDWEWPLSKFIFN